MRKAKKDVRQPGSPRKRPPPKKDDEKKWSAGKRKATILRLSRIKYEQPRSIRKRQPHQHRVSTWTAVRGVNSVSKLPDIMIQLAALNGCIYRLLNGCYH